MIKTNKKTEIIILLFIFGSILLLFIKKNKIFFFIILLIFLGLISISFKKTLEYFESENKIICYFHVCQKGEWGKSFDIIFNKIKSSGLYDNTNEIRLGILTENGEYIHDTRFDDPKIKIIYNGKYEEYERPTLLHMRKSSDTETNTKYYYLHTKGIKHFGTENENTVVNWINTMLYWNITKWKYAVEKLNTYETYGCHYNNIHYAGNFWWATSEHIKKLSDNIPDYYTAPEDWVLTNKDNMYCAHNCGENHKLPYKKGLY
jgi:hypothetical protein